MVWALVVRHKMKLYLHSKIGGSEFVESLSKIEKTLKLIPIFVNSIMQLVANFIFAYCIQICKDIF